MQMTVNIIAYSFYKSLRQIDIYIKNKNNMFIHNVYFRGFQSELEIFYFKISGRYFFIF